MVHYAPAYFFHHTKYAKIYPYRMAAPVNFIWSCMEKFLKGTMQKAEKPSKLHMRVQQ